MINDKKNDILLETGTNELELMEFTVSGKNFGINVSKVVEIMQYSPVTPMPNSNPYVEGIFKPRDHIMTVINLVAYMGLEQPEDAGRDILIITNFNQVRTAFHVHTVEAIHRISWTDIEKPDTAIYGSDEGLATGIARFENRLITIIDFEKILAEINPASAINLSEIEQMGERQSTDKPILVAEDSPLLERMIMQALEKSGFRNIIRCSNGQEAWDTLRQYKEADGPIEQYVACIVTDIEMPQMDGHRLTKLIRDDPVLNVLPVIYFSSLITDEMRKKGVAVGATEQLSKPQIGKLVSYIDKYIL